ncbi:MAG: hypothetical protein J1F31_04355 [Erysipelotrichales bacterium]|nr:hypothetical protein [Erysipelotrichales bacterium]
MKQAKKVIVALTALFMMTGCGNGADNLGKEVKMSKNEAKEKIEAAADSMNEYAGFKISEKSSEELGAIFKNETTVGDIVTTNTQKLSFNVTSESNIEIIKKTIGVDALIETSFSLSSESEGFDEKESLNASFNGIAGLYVKNTKLYGQTNINGDFNGEEVKLNEKFSVSLLEMESAFEEIFGNIGSDDFYPPIDDDTLMMIQTFLPEIEKSLPDPKAYEKGKDLTIVYSITMDDIYNAVDSVVSSYGELQPSLDLEKVAKEIKDEIASYFLLNEFSLSITIHDDKFISAIGFDVDLKLLDFTSSSSSSYEVGPDGEIIALRTSRTEMSYEFNSHSRMEISALNSDYKINFPSDMNSWPEIEF